MQRLPSRRRSRFAKATQTITFAALSNKTFGDAGFVLTATASSGLTVSLAASGNCGVSGTTVHLTSAGSCTITATQGGDANYSAASSVARTFAIAANLTPPTCNVPKVAGKTLAAAKAAIVNAHCKTGTVRKAYSTRSRRASSSRRA